MATREADWMRQAEEEWAAAKDLRATRHYSLACFAAHQAAEKALKAVLEYFRETPFGHDLDELRQKIEQYVSVPANLQQACSRLNKLYIPTRYPYAFATGAPADKYDDHETAQAIQDAEEVLSFARQALQTPRTNSLQSQPACEHLEQFLQRALEERGEQIEFVVLYGSRARGDWKPHSDFDILIGLCVDDDKNFMERFAEFRRFCKGWIEPFVYSRSEVDQLLAQFHVTILEACDHGIVLFDRGRWARIKAQFDAWKAQGAIERRKASWQIFPERIKEVETGA